MERKCMQKQRGFTLIELMVSLSIFAITIVISVGTLLVMIDANAKAQALYAATTNLSYALDNMTREMRMGYHYYCSNGGENQTTLYPAGDKPYAGCNGNGEGNFIAFTREIDKARIGYRRAPSEDDPTKNVIEQYVENAADPNEDTDEWIPITSSDVNIETFTVIVEGEEPYVDDEDDIDQPTVVLRIKGILDNGLDTDTTFDIQTRITQRRIDVQ